MKGHRNTDHPDDAGIEALLREVGARDDPSREIASQVFDAVKTEWHSVVNERRRHKRVLSWGIAAGVASFAVALGVGWRALQVETVTIASVAHIEGHLLGSSSGDPAWVGVDAGASGVSVQNINLRIQDTQAGGSHSQIYTNPNTFDAFYDSITLTVADQNTFGNSRASLVPEIPMPIAAASFG